MKNAVWVMIPLLLLYSVVPAQDQKSSAKLKEPKRNERNSPSLSEAEQLITEAGKLSEIGKFDEAIALVRRALEITEKLSPSNDGTVVAYLDYLARLYRANGEYDNALTLYLRMLKIQEARLGPMDFEVSFLQKLCTREFSGSDSLSLLL